MKILFVVPYVPNLIRVRPYNLVRYLTQAGHRVTLATLWSSPEELANLDEMKQTCEAVIAYPLPRWRAMVNSLSVLPTSAPIQSAYCWNPALAKAICAEAAGDYDIIHVEHLRGVRYGLNLLSHTHPLNAPIIWDSVDNIAYLFHQASRQSTQLLRRWFFKFEADRTQAYEASLPSHFQRVLVSSRIDQEEYHKLLAARGIPSNICVLPNGADLDYFQPDERATREPDTLVITGKMSYHANIRMVLHFMNAIMPKIWAFQPGVKVWVVGKDPSRSIQELSADPRVTVTGTVPDIRPYLQKATLAISPLVYGAGSQMKVFEAMACATPLVASSRSIAPLDAVQPGVHLLTAEDEAGFAQQVIELLNHPDRRRQIGLAGRKYVEEHYHWKVIVSHLCDIYQEAYSQFHR